MGTMVATNRGHPVTIWRTWKTFRYPLHHHLMLDALKAKACLDDRYMTLIFHWKLFNFWTMASTLMSSRLKLLSAFEILKNFFNSIFILKFEYYQATLKVRLSSVCCVGTTCRNQEINRISKSNICGITETCNKIKYWSSITYLQLYNARALLLASGCWIFCFFLQKNSIDIFFVLFFLKKPEF